MDYNKIKQQLLGKTCWRAWDGLLPAIFFELGEKISKRKGEISLCLDTCPWQILIGNHEYANSKDPRGKILLAIKKIEGSEVTDFLISDKSREVSIVFNQATIRIFLNQKSDNFYILDQNDKVIFNFN